MDTFLGRKSEVKKALGRTRHRWGTLKLILKRGYGHDSAGLRKRQMAVMNLRVHKIQEIYSLAEQLLASQERA